MQLVKKNLFILFLTSLLVIVPVVSFAQGSAPANPNASTPARLDNPLKSNSTIPELIRTILVGMLKIGIPVVALAIIYCGFLFVAARGKPEAITKAKSALLYTLIGAAILLGAWAIATLIANTVTGLGT